MKDAYIVEALRTPVAKANRGHFAKTNPEDLLAHCIRNTLSRHPGIDKMAIADAIIGCAMPEAEQGMNIARLGVLLAGLPKQVPAMTINRFCSSGVQSIATAADSIRLGEADLMLAGGVESMSMVPLGGNNYSANPNWFKQDETAIAFGMGITAENVAKKWNIDREAQDRFALESHQRAIAAQKAGYFEAEILPFSVEHNSISASDNTLVHREVLVVQDEGPRADTSFEALQALRPVFAKHGSVTAGNSSQTSDGAGISLLASEEALKRYDLKPIARLVSYAVAGVPPEIMGIGPIEAIPLALKRSGLRMQDIRWIELNEAFAAQSLAVMQNLELNPALVNPQGGAIALGHPLGATGAIRTATLCHGLKRMGGGYGMVTMCIGTGMGACAIFEVFP